MGGVMRDHCWHTRHCCHCGAAREAIERAAGYDEAHGSHVPVVRWVAQGVLREPIPDCAVERVYGANV